MPFRWIALTLALTLLISPITRAQDTPVDGYADLLSRYVNPAGGVNYTELQKDAKARAALDAYTASLAKLDLTALSPDERLATLINAYNAFTLRLILDHDVPASIKDIPEDQRWDAARWSLSGKQVSLNDIEHKMIRANFKEPRVHFALVCAAVGCPPLRAEPYTADRLEALLDDQARYVHTHDRWFQFNGEGVVKLTLLYQWYEKDFAPDGGGVLAFAAKYRPELKNNRPELQWLEYDWSLNSSQNLPTPGR